MPRSRRHPAAAVALAALPIVAVLGCSTADDAAPPSSPATTVGSAPATPAPATSAPTTATSVPTTAPPTSGPPTTVGTAIRSVAFGDQVLAADSCGGVFASPPPAGYPLQGGEARQGSPGDPTFYAVSVRPDPAYGDLTGDGQEDAVILVDCSPGTTPVTFAWAYGPGPGGSGQRLGGIALDQSRRAQLDAFADPRLTGVDLEGPTVVTTWATHQPGDPICCPTGQATVRFSWSGSAFTPGD